jgi:MFS superfamily sulfate permease-like transporter
MVVFFLTSGFMLPYVPTILAASLVQFLALEFFLKATWEELNTLTWLEYAVVWATLCSCSFLGFAEGFGVGIGAAILVYVIYSFMDAVRSELSANTSD